MAQDARRRRGGGESMEETVYFVREQIGVCRLCGKRKYLRCDSCFTCSDFVAGRKIPGGHELWDKRNPQNRWRITYNLELKADG